MRLETALHALVGGTGDRQADSTPSNDPAPADFEARFTPLDMALDSPLPSPPAQADSGVRMTLAVGDGETLAGVLGAADVSASDAQAAVEAAKRYYDPRKLKAGQAVTISFAAPGGTFTGFELQADGDRTVSVMRKGDGFAAEQAKIPMRTETRAARGVIHNSLFEAAADAGLPYAVTAAMIRAFSYDVDFQREIQPGDRFEVMYDSLVGQNGGHPGDLLYAQLVLSGKSHAIYGMRRDDGSIEFYTRDGKSVKKGLLRTPVDGARLSSGFGMRMHPILGYTRMHKGVDFAVPTGTPVYAAGDGVIEQSGWWGSYGRYVRIKHNQHMATAYAHLSRIATIAAPGQHVHQGEVIGYVGMTGGATGPHLHYEVLKDGGQVNPVSVSVPVNTGLEGKDLVAFRALVGEREQRFASLANGVQVAAAPGR